MINKYLFGLIECYECQGVCYVGNLQFNGTLMYVLFGALSILGIALIIKLILAWWDRFTTFSDP